jgi:hypothetical protein
MTILMNILQALDMLRRSDAVMPTQWRSAIVSPSVLPHTSRGSLCSLLPTGCTSILSAGKRYYTRCTHVIKPKLKSYPLLQLSCPSPALRSSLFSKTYSKTMISLRRNALLFSTSSPSCIVGSNRPDSVPRSRGGAAFACCIVTSFLAMKMSPAKIIL